MAYEVIKRVGDRAYRYRVEGYRDPLTGRARGRWTYLGRVEGGQTLAPQGAGPPVLTRERLLEAAERLLERSDHRRLTAARVAREAGLAHGTFYRYFKDKGEALLEVLARASQEVERLRAGFAGDPIGSRDAERERVRHWCEVALRARLGRRGILRTLFALSATDEAVSRMRRAWRERAVNDWSTYLERLRERGYVDFNAGVREIAQVFISIAEGCLRRAVSPCDTIGAGEIAATAEACERVIFGPPRSLR